jgi:hypothetical protein
MSPELLAWVIGIGNPTSALLTGPVLTRLAAAGRVSPHVARLGQGVGWVVLGVAQATFVVFGLTTGLDGFKFAQPVLIVIASVNFTIWLRMSATIKRKAQT